MKSKLLLTVVFFCFIFAATFKAQSKITLTVDTKTPGGVQIPDDYLGLSFEMGSMRVGNAGVTGNFFDDTSSWPSAQHSQLVTLFKTLGLKNIRMGGGSVDQNNTIPTNDDIDALFRFVKATDTRVIYSLRLLNGNITEDTNIAKYVWGKYKDYIDCFAIGNEPDWVSYRDADITGWPSYLDKWRRFATAVTTAVPEAKYGGPDTGSNYPVPGGKSTDYTGISWSELFTYNEKTTGRVKAIYLHNYVGQSASGTPQQMADKMLSSSWVSVNYPALYNSTCVNILNEGFPYRLTESNSFSGEVSGGSNCFASSLFTLDYLHWWAEHKASGVNFHNKQWLYNNTITKDAAGNFLVYPMAYGIKAFDLGGHGTVKQLGITNPDTLNLTAYAVGDTNNVYVTIINKEHGSSKRQASVEINLPSALIENASVMILKADNGSETSTSGITLGGATINNSGPWEGKWTSVDSVNSTGLKVLVPPTSAAIVKISGKITSISGTQQDALPKGFSLSQNYPNPFNPSTTINYEIPQAGNVLLKVYNMLGEEVRTLVDEFKSDGSYRIVWNGKNNEGKDLPSGIYVYSLSMPGKGQLNRVMMLLK